MKYFIQDNYPELGNGKERSFGQIRSIVEEAWNSISSEDLLSLLRTMPASCEAVVEAHGGPTKY